MAIAGALCATNVFAADNDLAADSDLAADNDLVADDDVVVEDVAAVGTPRPLRSPEAGAFRAWPGLGLGHRVGGGALAGPQLAFTMPVLAVLEPEVMVGFGVHASAAAVDVTNRFSFGLRWFVPPELAGGAGAFGVDEPVRPFLWTALHHGHTVAAADVVKNPIGALLTSTAAGVGHLTGLEAGVGVLLGVAVDGHEWPVLLRGGVSWLPALASLEGAADGNGAIGDLTLLTFDVAVGLPLTLNGD